MNCTDEVLHYILHDFQRQGEQVRKLKKTVRNQRWTLAVAGVMLGMTIKAISDIRQEIEELKEDKGE